MDTSEQVAIETSSHTKRRRRTVEEKRRIVEETLEAGASVARVARRHAVNANQVFYWRKKYREDPYKSGGHSTASTGPFTATIRDYGLPLVPLLRVTIRWKKRTWNRGSRNGAFGPKRSKSYSAMWRKMVKQRSQSRVCTNLGISAELDSWNRFKTTHPPTLARFTLLARCCPR